MSLIKYSLLLYIFSFSHRAYLNALEIDSSNSSLESLTSRSFLRSPWHDPFPLQRRYSQALSIVVPAFKRLPAPLLQSVASYITFPPLKNIYFSPSRKRRRGNSSYTLLPLTFHYQPMQQSATWQASTDALNRLMHEATCSPSWPYDHCPMRMHPHVTVDQQLLLQISFNRVTRLFEEPTEVRQYRSGEIDINRQRSATKETS